MIFRKQSGYVGPDRRSGGAWCGGCQINDKFDARWSVAGTRYEVAQNRARGPQNRTQGGWPQGGYEDVRYVRFSCVALSLPSMLWL